MTKGRPSRTRPAQPAPSTSWRSVCRAFLTKPENAAERGASERRLRQHAAPGLAAPAQPKASRRCKPQPLPTRRKPPPTARERRRKSCATPQSPQECAVGRNTSGNEANRSRYRCKDSAQDRESQRRSPSRNPPPRILRNNVAITYTSGEQVEVYRFSIPATILIPLTAVFLQAWLPLRLPFLHDLRSAAAGHDRFRHGAAQSAGRPVYRRLDRHSAGRADPSAHRALRNLENRGGISALPRSASSWMWKMPALVFCSRLSSTCVHEVVYFMIARGLVGLHMEWSWPHEILVRRGECRAGSSDLHAARPRQAAHLVSPHRRSRVPTRNCERIRQRGRRQRGEKFTA